MIREKYARLKMMRKRQLMRTMCVMTQMTPIEIQKYVNHGHLRNNSILAILLLEKTIFNYIFNMSSNLTVKTVKSIYNLIY
jgi:hypothetical protein